MCVGCRDFTLDLLQVSQSSNRRFYLLQREFLASGLCLDRALLIRSHDKTLELSTKHRQLNQSTKTHTPLQSPSNRATSLLLHRTNTLFQNNTPITMAPKPVQYHDTSSGLSWNETIISTSSRPISSQIHDFLHRAVGVPPPLYTSKEHGLGVDALETMALRCLLNNLAMLEAESLEPVPEIVLKRLWREIQKK